VSAPTPWRTLWEEITAEMETFGDAQAKATGRLISKLRLAVTRYGEELDPDGFDEFGEIIEPEEAEG